MQATDAAQITAQQQANWDRHADTYAEVVIGNDDIDAATPHVIIAIKKHKELASGKQGLFKLKEGRVIALLACCMSDAACTPVNRVQNLRHCQQFWKTSRATRHRISTCTCYIH